MGIKICIDQMNDLHELNEYQILVGANSCGGNKCEGLRLFIGAQDKSH